jgi:hypothetical protein
VSAGIEKAIGYGLREAVDFRRYVELSLLLGNDFDTDPCKGWIGEILCDESLEGPEKMLWIEDGLESGR